MIILVVDDNRQFCETLTEFLSFHGHRVQQAADGAEALQMLARCELPQLIFLDPEVPILDGWDFLGALRRQETWGGIPVVIISTLNSIAERAKEAGAVAVVRKPAHPQMLLRVIERFAGRASARVRPTLRLAGGLRSVNIIEGTPSSRVFSSRHRSPRRVS